MATWKVNYPVEYHSTTLGKWTPTHIRQIAEDGGLELACKEGQFFTLRTIGGALRLPDGAPIPPNFIDAIWDNIRLREADQHVRDVSGQPSARPTPATGGTQSTSIFSTPGKPELKRTRTEQAAPLQVSLTADAVAAAPLGLLPGGIPGVPLGSTQSFPGTDAPEVADAGGGTAAFDPWKTAAVERGGPGFRAAPPGVPQQTSPPEQDFWSKFDTKLGDHTQQITTNIDGMRNDIVAIGQRVGNLEIGQAELKTDVDIQKAELGALRTEFGRLQSDVEA